MIDAFDLYKSFQSIVNTYVGGWFRPQTDFITKINDVSNELWEIWTRQAERSQEIVDNLFPFLKSKNIIVKSQSSYYGTFETPTDYGRFASARLIVAGRTCVPCKDVDNGQCVNGDLKTEEEIAQEYYDTICERTVEKIDNIKWGSVCEHLTKAPTLENPKLTQIDGGFKVAPRQVSVVVLDYYVRPTNATFVYSISPGNTQTGAGDQIIYNQAQSIPLQWPNTVRNEFLWRLGEYYGIFTRDQFIAQAANNLKLTD